MKRTSVVIWRPLSEAPDEVQAMSAQFTGLTLLVASRTSPGSVFQGCFRGRGANRRLGAIGYHGPIDVWAYVHALFAWEDG